MKACKKVRLRVGAGVLLGAAVLVVLSVLNSGSPEDKEYRKLLRNGKLLAHGSNARRSSGVFGWLGSFRDAVFPKHRWAQRSARYQAEYLRLESSLLSSGYLVATNLGNIPDYSGFLRTAVSNVDLGGPFPRWDRHAKYWRIGHIESTNYITLVFLPGAANEWVSFRNSWMARHDLPDYSVENGLRSSPDE